MRVFLGGALGFGVGRVAEVLAQRLRRAGDVQGPIVALEEGLARALSRLGLDVVAVLPAPRRRRGRGPTVVAALAHELPFDDGSVAALVAVAVPPATLASALAEGARVVRAGGVVALASSGAGLVRQPPPPEVYGGAFLHAALVDIEQQLVGRSLLTYAAVPDLPR